MNGFKLLASILLLFLLIGCVDERNVPVPEISKEKFKQKPQKQITEYDDALAKLGQMLELYQESILNVQTKPINNMTSEKGTLPSDITKMVISSLNKIGPKVRVIPYDTDFIGRIATIAPNIVVDGAITEFDKLESVKQGLNAGVQAGKGTGLSYADLTKTSTEKMARISLDFNLIDFSTNTFISQMQANNSMRVYEVSRDNDFGFSIFGTGFGLEASAKKAQGKHAAIRLLVELSMLELIGKYKMLPYWLCIPNGKPDKIVLKKIREDFASMDDMDKIKYTQILLKLNGYNVSTNSILDYNTKKSILNYKEYVKLFPVDERVDDELYIKLLTTAPAESQRTEGKEELNKEMSELL